MWGSTKIGVGRWSSQAGNPGSSPGPHAIHASFAFHCLAYTTLVVALLSVVGCMPDPLPAQDIQFGTDVPDYFYPVYHGSPVGSLFLNC